MTFTKRGYIETVMCIFLFYFLGYQDSENWEIYIASMYFTLTTITTVGFGDISGFTIEER